MNGTSVGAAARMVSVEPSMVPTSRSISSTSLSDIVWLFWSRNSIRCERYTSPQCSSWLLPSKTYGLSAGLVFQFVSQPCVGLTESRDFEKGT